MQEVYKYFTNQEQVRRQETIASMADMAIRKGQANCLGDTGRDDVRTPAEENDNPPPTKAEMRATKVEVPGRPGFYYTGGGLDPIDIPVTFDYDDETREIRRTRRLEAVARMRKILLEKMQQETSSSL